MLCTCGKIGRYMGTQPVGGMMARVAFDCVCGAIWGLDVRKEEVEKYRE
jgi:hypothetical protein